MGIFSYYIDPYCVCVCVYGVYAYACVRSEDNFVEGASSLLPLYEQLGIKLRASVHSKPFMRVLPEALLYFFSILESRLLHLSIQ